MLHHGWRQGWRGGGIQPSKPLGVRFGESPALGLRNGSRRRPLPVPHSDHRAAVAWHQSGRHRLLSRPVLPGMPFSHTCTEVAAGYRDIRPWAAMRGLKIPPCVLLMLRPGTMYLHIACLAVPIPTGADRISLCRSGRIVLSSPSTGERRHDRWRYSSRLNGAASNGIPFT